MRLCVKEQERNDIFYVVASSTVTFRGVFRGSMEGQKQRRKDNGAKIKAQRQRRKGKGATAAPWEEQERKGAISLSEKGSFSGARVTRPAIEANSLHQSHLQVKLYYQT